MATERVATVKSWAVKYRPRKLSDVVGQDNAVLRLRGMLKSKELPAALLFAGPTGCGKTTLARLFSRYVNCDTLSACGKCESCQQHPDNHPDVNELNAATQRGIDDARNMIQQATFAPRFNVRIFIIDEAHQLTPQAQQALLKPLEQPPDKTMFIVCTTDPQKFPEAMLTRFQRIEVGIPSKEEIIKRLTIIAEKEGVKFPDGVIKSAAEYSGGYVRTAITLLEGAAQILRVEPKIDPKLLLKRIATSAVPEVNLVATKVLLGLYLGKRKPIVSAIFDNNNAIELLNCCLRMNQYYLGCVFAPDSRNLWHAADLRKFRAVAKEKCGDVPPEKLLEVQRRLTSLRAELNNFSVSELSLLLARLV